MPTFFIDKSSGTFADTLAAYGLAFVVQAVTVQANGGEEVVMEDVGPYFAIHTTGEIETDRGGDAFFVGAPFLITTKAGTKLVKGTALHPSDLPASGGETVADYEAEKVARTQFFDWLKSLSKEEKQHFASETLTPPVSPHPDWELFRAVNPAALQTYNALLAEWWRGREAFGPLLNILLTMTAQSPNDVDGARDAWAALCKAQGWDKPKEVTATQLLNPVQGKGTHAIKAAWSTPGNLKGFWLLEWLKLVGLRFGGFTRQVKSTKDRKVTKDRKTYALLPKRLSWSRHQQVLAKFKRNLVSSQPALKLDIVVALYYTRALLEHYQEARQADFMAEFFGRPVTDLVAGVQTAFYKSLGNAIATMNVATLALPGWVRPSTQADLARLRAAIDEHLSIVRGLDESRSDQYDLLHDYRNFLSAHSMEAFFRFSNAYSTFIIKQRERRKPVRQFSTEVLEIQFMNSDTPHLTYSAILSAPGFRNIANAIRRSTVVPQIRKGKKLPVTVDIRYGLGQQLTRKAAYPDEFLTELSAFVHLYNAENAQLLEKNRLTYRKLVTTTDLEEVAALVDRFGSKVVANMLVAFGYARQTGSQDEKIDSIDPQDEIDDDETSADHGEDQDSE